MQKLLSGSLECSQILKHLFLFQESLPAIELERIRSESGCCPDVDSEAFAKYMDVNDPLRGFRAKFQYPKKKELPIGE